MFRRVFSLILALVFVCAPLLGGVGTVRAASNDDMEAIIEKQIRAFADSIDQSNADTTAAKILATHGLTGRGKTLTANKNHSLTATLFNSELLQTVLTEVCTEAIRSMQTLDLASMPYIRGFCCWYGPSDSFYYCATYEQGNWEDNKVDWYLNWRTRYTGSRNGYDESLDWMAANTQIFLNVSRTKVTATEVTYSVTCKVTDRFDFRTGNGSGFKDLISGLAAVAFREYDWEASVTFNLTVPYSCTHASGMYCWHYDADTREMEADDNDGCMKNDITRHRVGESGYYYELDETVRLYHDVPWVLEYDAKQIGNIALTAFEFETASVSRPCFFIVKGEYLFAYKRFHFRSDADVQNDRKDFYGVTLRKLLPSANDELLTYRLENIVNADGSNMIYLTVLKPETGELLLDRIPMDYHYQASNSYNYQYTNKGDTWVSGKDFYIHYIGNKEHPFSADHFDLRIWENGIEGGNGTHCRSQITKPTCTKQGYTTYTCSCCGYSYKGDKVKATGHNYENYVCTGCGDRLYIPGDVDTNGTVDVDDVLTLLWNVLFPEEYPIEAPSDFDGNGATDVDDVLTLLWHVLFPEEYPLN